MNLRRQRPSDSLDMLLDTMCNTFGGIILLAVLVTLLTSRERQESAATASESREMLQRRLVMAQANLQQSAQLQAALQAKASDERWKKQVSLLAARQQIQEEIKSVREFNAQNAKELDITASVDPAERMKQLNAQLAAAQARKRELTNILDVFADNTSRLKTRYAELVKKADAKFHDSQRELRLPKEHETGKSVIYVIAEYGRIYVCRFADLSRNERDIDWSSTSSSEVAEPKKGRGVDPFTNAAELEDYLRKQADGSVYVVFCVFEDSFPAFIKARQIAVQSGLLYGWQPYRLVDAPISFGRYGYAPMAQ